MTNYKKVTFGDNPKMIDKLGRLVQTGVKTATSSLLWEYEFEKSPLPKKGEYCIVTDSRGNPLCIIKIKKVSIKPFNEVDERHALKEGEGNRTMAYWRKVHWSFFGRVCKRIGKKRTKTMPIVCETFEVL